MIRIFQHNGAAMVAGWFVENAKNRICRSRNSLNEIIPFHNFLKSVCSAVLLRRMNISQLDRNMVVPVRQDDGIAWYSPKSKP